MSLSERQEAICAANETEYGDLRALLVNTSLKRRAEESHTRLLLDVVGTIFAKAGAKVEHVHLLDHQVPPGVYPDMTEHGWESDDWPALWEKVEAADILIGLAGG